MDYCARWREHKSNYALTHYAEHLFEMHRTEDLYKLICRSFMQEKLTRFGSHQSFAEDVMLAIAAAHSKKDMVQEMRGIIIYAKLLSLTIRMPLSIPGMLPYLSQFARAKYFASLMTNKALQKLAYLPIGLGYDFETENAVFNQAFITDEKIEEEYFKMLSEITRVMAQLGEKEKATEIAKRAVKVAEKIEDGYLKTEALNKIANAMAQLGEFGKALTMAKKIEKEVFKVEVSEIVGVMAQLGEKKEVTEIARRVQIPAMLNDVYKNMRVRIDTSELWVEYMSPEQRLSFIKDRFAAAQNFGLEKVLNELEYSASFIASIDDGQTLWKIYEAVVEVDDW